MVAAPRWNAMNPEALNQTQISLSSDTLAICDQIDPKCKLRAGMCNLCRTTGWLREITGARILHDIHKLKKKI